MSDLAIEKERLDVSVHFTDGSKTRGSVFLSTFSSRHHGHQKVADLLEDEKAFIPLSIEGGGVEFVGKSQVLMIEGELIEEEEIYEAAGLLHEEEVSIIITDAYIINGLLLAEVPPERSRLSDCLNLPENFIRMKSEGRYLHVNKKLIMKVLSRV